MTKIYNLNALLQQRTRKKKPTGILSFLSKLGLALLLGVSSFEATAQSVTIPSANTNSGGQNRPLSTYYGYLRTASIYTPAEIGAVGSISHIGFYLNSVASAGAATDVRIYLKERSTLMTATSLYSAETTGATLVYGPATIPASSFTANGWVTIPLTTPFDYTGGSNNLEVIVETNATGTGNETSSGKVFRYNTQSNSSYFQYWETDTTPSTTSGTRNANRPNIRITFVATALPSCASALTPSDLSTTARNPTLTWSGLADSYDVYFGTVPNPPLVTNTFATSYTPPILAASTTYYWKVVPKNSLGDATGCVEQSFTTNTSLNYCTSNPSTNNGSGITNVKFAGTDFPNGDVTYADYSSTVLNVAQGANAELLVTFATGVTYNTNVWIDFNDNGVFTDAGELVYQGNSTATNPTTLNASFVLPFTATLGAHKMRIGTADTGQATPNPCYNGTLGVTIDMSINVTSLPTDLPDYANLQYPTTGTVSYGNGLAVYAQIYEGGLTDVEPGLSGQAAGVTAWIGLSTTNTDPSTWTNWTTATHNGAHVSNNDEYTATIGATLVPGTYYYASRFRLNGGAYRYGGIDSSGNGSFWDGTTYNSGVLTVTGPANDECSNATVLVVGTQITSSNRFATKSADADPTCAIAGSPSFATGGKDVWFSVQVPANIGRLDIETNNDSDGAMTDSGMMAYRGVCGALVGIECDDDDSPDGNFSLLNLTGLVPGEIIYVRVWGYGSNEGRFKIKTSIPATCSAFTVWDGAAWSNGAPVAGVDAVFNGNYSGAAVSACSIFVNGTAQVVFTSGSDVNLAGNVNVASTASLTLSNDVNLIQSVSTANVGNVTINRESAPMIRLDHTLWSSPVVAQNLYAFSPNTLTNRFYVYDTATDRYVTTGLSATTNFAAAKGYAIRAANDHPSTATPWTGTFSGVPRNGSTSFTMTNAGNGFNLVGNPYPSVIDAAALVSANSARITGTLYFYAHTLGMLSDGTYPAGSNYALWNATGSTASTPGTAGIPANVPNGKINVGQGFIVKRSGTGDLSFTNAMREASHGNQFFRTADNNVEKHRVWLNLTNADNSAFSQMLVGYVDGATQAFDNLFDGESFGQEGSFIASKLDNKNFTIQGRALPFSDEDVVAMNFHAATAGNFTISLSQMDGIFAADQSVYIKDNQTGATHDLKASPYTFVSGAGDFDSRFQIVYRSALSTPEATFNADAVVAFVRNNALNIQTKNVEMKGIAIYDLRGRLLFENNKVNAENYVVPNFASQNQVILVKVTSQNNETVTVKVIF